jgi:Mg2+ and Co2+ transporter CorA
MSLLANDKTAKFIYQVFEGIVGDILDATYPIINEAVQNAEKIGNYIVANTTASMSNTTELQDKIFEMYGYKIETSAIEYLRQTESKIKGIGKYLIAYKIIKDRLEVEGKKFIPSIINLGIELAVARYFTKKKV